jgi:uncharacterized protein YbaP (TraB family)
MRVRSLLGALALCLLFAGPAAHAAQPCPPMPSLPDPQALRKAAADHGFLWRISKDGRASYLYGTLHLGRPEWFFPGRRVRQALEASDTVALELDIDDPATTAELEAASQGAAAAELPAALAERLARQVAAACLPPGAFGRLHPVLQVTTLAALSARVDGLHVMFAQEASLAAFARSRGRPLVALETAGEQMRALLPQDEQEGLAEVDQQLQQLEAGRVRPVLRQVAEVWAQGRLDELERYERWCDCADTPQERAQLARLNDERNPHLAERIDALHGRGQRVFAAVGALHMTGPQGLPRLMAARGYLVERIPFPP